MTAHNSTSTERETSSTEPAGKTQHRGETPVGNVIRPNANHAEKDQTGQYPPKRDAYEEFWELVESGKNQLE